MKLILTGLVVVCVGLIGLIVDLHPIDAFHARQEIHTPFGDCVAEQGVIVWIPTPTQSWQCGHWPK